MLTDRDMLKNSGPSSPSFLLLKTVKENLRMRSDLPTPYSKEPLFLQITSRPFPTSTTQLLAYLIRL